MLVLWCCAEPVTAVKSGTMVTASVSLSLMLATSKNTFVTVAEVSRWSKLKRNMRESVCVCERERQCVRERESERERV